MKYSKIIHNIKILTDSINICSSHQLRKEGIYKANWHYTINIEESCIQPLIYIYYHILNGYMQN